MISPDEVRKLASALNHVTEAPHHQIISFKVKSRIFATLNLQENRACLKLSTVDQDVFSTIQKENIYPVPNAWGKYGWTLVNLKKVRKTIFRDALSCAYDNVVSSSSKKKKTK
jgi:predicted DNA-binding protein (MmcQ/YjbR family)